MIVNSGSRNNSFYDLDSLFGYYFMKGPGNGSVSFSAKMFFYGGELFYVVC